jgi:hypothetical protein
MDKNCKNTEVRYTAGTRNDVEEFLHLKYLAASERAKCSV